MLEWISIKPWLAGWVFTLSILMFVGSLLLLPVLVARIRSDYFVRRTPPAESWLGQHIAVWVTFYAVKNLLGVILLLAGIAMLVLPGQGLLTMLVGITLLNFPGKRRLELRFVRLPRVLKAINWMRRRAGRPPLVLPPERRSVDG
jgi:hypothetical protein